MSDLAIAWKDSAAKNAPTAMARGADGREYWLHSRVDPLEEARFFVRDVPRRARTMYVVLGFGLGYHVKELLQAIPRSSHVIVIEPDTAAFSCVAIGSGRLRSTAWTNDQRLHRWIVRDAQIVPLRLADAFTNLDVMSLQLLTHIPSTLVAGDFYREVAAAIPMNLPVAAEAHLAAIDRMLENDLTNFWANLPLSWKNAPIDALRGRWARRPAIIVSAGPSLTAAIPLLRERRPDVLLVATATVARLLRAEQIPMDVVVSVDPYDPNFGHFEGWDTSGVPLVYYQRIYREIPRHYHGPAFSFAMQDEPPIPLIPRAPMSPFTRGGTVAFSALQLAHYLQADPILFVGQDFAFADEHTHAAGTTYNRALAPEATSTHLRIPGVRGRSASTDRIYYSYLLHMQEYLGAYAKARPAVRHVNTSEIGARIEGTQEVPLAEALAALSPDGTSARSTIGAAWTSGVATTSSIGSRAFAASCVAEIDRLLARSGEACTFPELFERFRKTSMYRHAKPSYEHVRYVYESRHHAHGPSVAFLERFVRHLEDAADSLRPIADLRAA